MIRKSLEEERRRQKKVGAWVVEAVASGALLGISVFLGFVKFDFSRLADGVFEEQPDLVGVPLVDHESVRKFAGERTLERTPGSTVADSQQGIQNFEANGTPGSPYRAKFQSEISIFENEFDAEISSAGFSAWNKMLQRELLETKRISMNLYSQGRYMEAYQEIVAVNEIAKNQFLSKLEAISELYRSAEIAYQNDDHDLSLGLIEQALLFDPGAVTLKKLKEKISRLPGILESLRDAQTARAENNPQKELFHLEEVYSFDPTRDKVQWRMESLRAEIREENFASSISIAMASVEQKELLKAWREFEEAKNIFPDRSELRVVERAIRTLELEIKIRELLTLAEAASNNDEWKKAERYFLKAETIAPNNKRVVEGIKISEQVINATAIVEKYIACPHRLSSDNVAKSAQDFLWDQAKVAQFSGLLSAKMDRLEQLVISYGTKVAVRLVSDELTFVSIRGLGSVGKISEKVIQIRPGKYTIEGSREGFRSKLVEFEIKPESKLFSIEIYCDERI